MSAVYQATCTRTSTDRRIAVTRSRFTSCITTLCSVVTTPSVRPSSAQALARVASVCEHCGVDRNAASSAAAEAAAREGHLVPTAYPLDASASRLQFHFPHGLIRGDGCVNGHCRSSEQVHAQTLQDRLLSTLSQLQPCWCNPRCQCAWYILKGVEGVWWRPVRSHAARSSYASSRW